MPGIDNSVRSVGMALLVGGAACMASAACGDADWAQLNAAAREQAKMPVRTGVPGVRPFWNVRSHSV